MPSRHLAVALAALSVLAAGLLGTLSLVAPPAAASLVVPQAVTAPRAISAPHTAAPHAAAGGCRTPAPRTAGGYQAMFDAKNDRTWAGGDQAATVPLPDGRVLWLFGDTVRGGRLSDGSRGPDSAFVHNSLLVQTGGCLEAVPAAAEVIPSRADGQWYWPMTGVVVGQRLVVLCARVRATGAGGFDFQPTGVDAAVFDLSSGLPRLTGMAATPSSRTPESGFQLGAAVVRDGGWLYVYGSRRQPKEFGRAVGVARVRPEALLDPRAWTYWTGSHWSARKDRMTPVVAAGPRGWSTAFSVWRDGSGRLRSLTKEQDVFGSAVVAAGAPAPTGPFSRTVVLRAPSTRDGVLLYNPLAHPELELADGRLLVTVCRNSADLKRVWADADLYKPQFAEVSVP